MTSTRIPCPYDPGHTCPADNVDKHLQICNSRPPDSLPPYLVTGINSGDSGDNDDIEHLTVATVTDEKLMEIIHRVEQVFTNNNLGDLVTEKLDHDILGPEVNNKEYGEYQIRSLLFDYNTVLIYIRTQHIETPLTELFPPWSLVKVRIIVR